MNNEFDFPKQLDGVAKICGACAALIVLFWKLVKPLVKWFRNWASSGERIDEMFAIVRRELKPNGTPIADKIAIIQGHVQVLTAREQLRFNNSPIPTYECDAEGKCIAVNPAWCELFGVTEHGMLGNGWLDVLQDPKERERVFSNWQESVKNRYPHREKYRAVNRITGQVLECESATIEMCDPKGKALFYVGSITKAQPVSS